MYFYSQNIISFSVLHKANSGTLLVSPICSARAKCSLSYQPEHFHSLQTSPLSSSSRGQDKLFLSQVNFCASDHILACSDQCQGRCRNPFSTGFNLTAHAVQDLDILGRDHHENHADPHRQCDMLGSRGGRFSFLCLSLPLIEVWGVLFYFLHRTKICAS